MYFKSQSTSSIKWIYIFYLSNLTRRNFGYHLFKCHKPAKLKCNIFCSHKCLIFIIMIKWRNKFFFMRGIAFEVFNQLNCDSVRLTKVIFWGEHPKINHFYVFILAKFYILRFTFRKTVCCGIQKVRPKDEIISFWFDLGQKPSESLEGFSRRLHSFINHSIRFANFLIMSLAAAKKSNWFKCLFYENRYFSLSSSS